MERTIFQGKRSWIIALIFIVLIGLFIQYPYMNEFPSYIHAWSQSDRYAIALGFLNNDLDLLHPETFIYNKQFPNDWGKAYETTITSVDFPLMEFVAAIIMKITGVTSPWVFRTCTLLVALIGMFFLYKLSLLITKDWIKSLLVTTVAMTSPVYAYYFNGFIPSVPALTSTIIALYFYVRYLNDDDIKQFYFTIIFITLSLLLRTSFAVIYVALLGFEFLRVLRKESKLVDKLFPVAVSFALFFSYFIWNKHLAAEHGTLFLGDLLPAKDWNDFWHRMMKANDNWKYHYFAKNQYLLFALVLISSISYFICGKIRNKDGETKKQKKSLSLWLFVLVAFFGYILFTIAMARQFPAHDYYFVDTYFMPILLLLILLLNMLPKVGKGKFATVFVALSVLFVIIMLVDVNKMQKLRRKNYWNYPAVRTINNYKDSERFLDSIGVPKDAKILTLWAYPQNTPFIMMNRKGFAEMFGKHDKVGKVLTFDYDYVILENELLKDDKKREYISDLKYVADNDKISVFVKSDEY